MPIAAIEVSSDQINPTRVKPDLTKLTDEELRQLERIVLKVGTGASGGPDGNADHHGGGPDQSRYGRRA
jgi:hypothetical protein